MKAAAPMDLFSLPPAPVVAKAPRHKMAGHGIPLRHPQVEDVDGMFYAIEGGAKKPCAVGATGYGKSAIIAETSGRMHHNGGKVLVLVDRAHLVNQNADEIERHLDLPVGRVADGNAVGMHLPIVVATVQAMYTPDRSGRPLHEYPQFRDVRNVIADEAHKFFAPKFSGVIQHFIDGNDAQAALFTATPVAANGAAWQSFVDWTPTAEGPCMRTADWCIRNGYLVRPRQAFVRVDLDLSSIYERLQFAGDGNDSDADDAGDELSAALLGLLRDRQEQAAAKFAAGVAKLLGDRRSIIFSPARVDAAKLLAAWIGASGAMTCEAVWGSRADKADVLRRHASGIFQALANVNLLCEGYNDPTVSAVFICRLLKQWRLVAQMIGRGLRPHPSIVSELSRLDGPENADARCRLIAGSVKPDCIIADLVGLDGKVLQASAIDVLHANESEDTRQVMGEMLYRRQAGARPDDIEAGRPTKELVEEARSELLNRQHQQLADLARKRGMTGGIDADVHVSFTDAGPVVPSAPAPIQCASLGERARFVAYALKYDAANAVNIANSMPRNKLRGMTAGAVKALGNGRPDWKRAREAYPEWANQRRSA